MRIAIAVTARVTADTFVQGFARFAATNGHEITVLADGLEEHFERIGDGSLRFVPISMRRDPSPKQDLWSLFSLVKALRSIKPEVMVYATPKASLLGSMASFITRVPTRIYQLWGLRLETVHGPGRAVLTALELVTARLSTSVLANSDSLAKRYQSLHLANPKHLTVIGKGSSHGVDLEYFSPAGCAASPDCTAFEGKNSANSVMTLGFVGRLHPDKGIDTFIDALELLITRGRNVSAVIVGNDEGFQKTISDRVSSVLDFVGYAQDTRPYYQAMDVLVLPSLREGFPNVVLEAASMGVPAVVSDGTGVRDSVVDGETGSIFPVHDSRALADAIQNLIENPDLVERFGTAARKRAEKHFDQEYVWRETLSFITG
ncbi:GDP-mannose-dependent alpha-mannosyltransferase [Corynebacterium kalinowskii]|uniref:GDP-mannose-dependent alpha-mannosyltransferase n=1 Tax=Corynebacterium kalinowskii TaxID=2675216 RepID=A0A6B8V9F2_9CORY|nr:glycosyltransferase family 4 protein [Corynebacterium kalinowskii]QGU01013.1 GDP-mannose-dependent alpha-mannosyltransferase [Corynebacterium kalinowskii]